MGNAGSIEVGGNSCMLLMTFYSGLSIGLSTVMKNLPALLILCTLLSCTLGCVELSKTGSAIPEVMDAIESHSELKEYGILLTANKLE